MHVENWPKGTRENRFNLPKQTTRSNAADDEVIWPEADSRTGTVPPAERDFGVPRQPDAATGHPAAPWEQPDQPGHNHDPLEVTVQLDGAGREVAEGPGTAATGAAGPQEADGPVFVDESGRRRNLYRRLGIAVGTACAAYAVVIVGTLVSGNSDAPWLPVPMQKDEKPAGKVDTPPLPGESADDRADTADGGAPGQGTGSAVPSGATTAPGGGSRGGASGKGEDRDGKEPTPSTSAQPSAGSSASAAPKPSTSVSTPTPSASVTPSGDSPSPAVSPSPPLPSESSGADAAPGSGDTNTVADGPQTPAPVEPGPAAPDDPQQPQDPQNPEKPA